MVSEDKILSRNHQTSILQASISDQRPNLKVWINHIITETDTDIIISSPKFWPKDWLLWWINIQLLGICTLSQVKQSIRWFEYMGLEGQTGKLAICD